ncbi:MAG: M20 family metallopeptidase, partial [Clostridiales bacterium]|nr:M20 family metallopeptidase [Clostridiales bacterium]
KVCCGQRGAMSFQLSIPFEAPVTIEMNSHPSVTPEEIQVTFSNGNTFTIKGQSAHVYNAPGKKNAVLETISLLQTHLPEKIDSLQSLHFLCSQTDGAPLGIHFTDEESGPLLMAPTGIAIVDQKLVIRAHAILPITSHAEQLSLNATKIAENHGVLFQVSTLRLPSSFPMDHPIVSLLTDTYNKVMNVDSAPFVMSGGNYAAFLPRAFGFGPGMPGREFPPHIFREGRGDYHQLDESEDIERVLNFMRIYAMSIVALDQIDLT